LIVDDASGLGAELVEILEGTDGYEVTCASSGVTTSYASVRSAVDAVKEGAIDCLIEPHPTMKPGRENRRTSRDALGLQFDGLRAREVWALGRFLADLETAR
jgi:CheY-like chemotaxis protein